MHTDVESSTKFLLLIIKKSSLLPNQLFAFKGLLKCKAFIFPDVWAELSVRSR